MMVLWLLRTRDLLCLLPYSFVRHLVAANELAILHTRETFALAPVGLLTPATNPGHAADTLKSYLLRRFRSVGGNDSLPACPGNRKPR